MPDTKIWKICLLCGFVPIHGSHVFEVVPSWGVNQENQADHRGAAEGVCFDPWLVEPWEIHTHIPFPLNF